MGASGDPKDALVRDIVTAMLAVNNWTMEKAHSILPGLEKEQLLDLAWVRLASKEELAVRLNRAGYTRGSYMLGSMTENFRSLASELDDEKIASLLVHVSNRDFNSIAAVLTKVRGVGPSVLQKLNILLAL